MYLLIHIYIANKLQIETNENSILKPVMFWIHGGGFFSGAGSTNTYGPDFLVAHNVVLVTINYRVGLLGKNHWP